MNKHILAILVLMLVVLGACSQKQAATTGKAFVGGTKGLEISFLSGRPPEEVFDSNFPFQVGVKLENKGEWDITTPSDVKVSVTGINPADFKVSQANLMLNSPEQLRGLKLDNAGNIILGDFVNVEFPELNYYTTVSGSVPFTVRTNVCYEYGTKAQGKLCVRKDLRKIAGNDGFCDPNREVPAENSGAPVQVTNIRQNVGGSNKIDVFFTVKNMGVAGDSLHKEKTSCDSLSISNRDVVFVNVADTGLGDLTCSGLTGGAKTSGYTTLFNGEREIRCTQTINTPDDFEKIINVELRYGYKQYVDKQIKVSHSS